MADATVIKRIETHVPTEEVVQLEATDGETYTSKKFSKVYAAVACCNENSVQTAVSVITTGTTGVITINWDGCTDKDMTLIIKGNLGN